LVTLDAYASHHLSKVLRFPEGKNITLFNGDGMNYSAQVLQTKKNNTAQKAKKMSNMDPTKNRGVSSSSFL
jgi:16S rRNA (uracil1498-N3)-methyltransferase